jgi:hypothetical protein
MVLSVLESHRKHKYRSVQFGVKGLIRTRDSFVKVSRGNSVSIVSGYGLDDRAIEVRSPAEAKGFPLYALVLSRPALGPTQPPVQWVPGIISPGLKRGWGLTLTTHPHLVPRSWMSRWYTPSPPKHLVVSSDTALAFNFVKKCLETVSDCNMIPVLRLTLL